MTDYTFTCPLSGCGVVMKASGETKEAAAGVLVAQAKAHLVSVHPEIKKTDEEVNIDIHSYMVAAQ